TLRLAHGKASALDVELCDAIADELRAARGARAVILTGTGSIFSAGVDLFRMTNEGAEYVDRFIPALGDAFTTLFEFPGPIVAADQLMQRANDEAKRLAAIPPESFRLTKMQLRGIATDEADVKKVWADPDIHTHIRDYLAKTIKK